MAEITTLQAAVSRLIHHGDTVAMEGFTHLIPHAAGHEIIRQKKRDLDLIRMTPDVIYDQLIGAGCARRITFSWGGNPGVGSLHRLRDAVENKYPQPIDIVEHSHAAMATAYQAGASRLPFATLRAYAGNDLPAQNDSIRSVTCPYTGETLATVPAHRPDATVIHAQRADEACNVQCWGIVGVQKEAALAADRVVVTVEEVVEDLTPVAGGVVLPAWMVDAVCVVPGGAYPSYAQDYYDRDNRFYLAWDDISRDRDRFAAWIDRHVRSTRTFAEFRHSLANGHSFTEPALDAMPTPADGHSDVSGAPDGNDAPASDADAALADPSAAPTSDEIMTIVASRALADAAVCFVGIGLPSAAANLARRTHAPGLVLIYESGTIGAKPEVLPLSIGDGELAATADVVVSVPEIFSCWLQAGRIDVGFLGAAQIDRYGNINTTVIGRYDAPTVRLPGAGGAPEIAAHAAEVFILLRHEPRKFVETLDFVTSVGHLDGGDARERLGLRGRGPTKVITDLGILAPDPRTKELTLTTVHPGVGVDEVRAATGWPLRVADSLDETPPPTDAELATLRALNEGTEAAHRPAST